MFHALRHLLRGRPMSEDNVTVEKLQVKEHIVNRGTINQSVTCCLYMCYFLSYFDVSIDAC